ncbi:MAG TPA: MFS transporter, partial [Nitrososphaerales archaeon]|nr:MFS transporter [Nitrososphaerales archaeon]
MQNTSIDHPRRADSFSSALFLGVMTMGYAVYAIDRYVLSAVLSPMSSALHLSSTEVGLIGSAQYIGVLCLVFFAGYLSDRYGRMRIIISGIVIFSAFTWLIGLSSSFGEAFLFRLISGFGEGMFWPTAMAAVATNYGKNKGLSLGIFYVGFDAGGAAGLSIGGISFYLTQDWRTAFFVAPLLGLLVIGGAYAYKNW